METYLNYGEYYLSGYLIPWHANMDEAILYLTTKNPPGYPILTGVLRWLFGWENIRCILFFQAFADFLAVFLFAFAGRRLFGARTGLLSALLFAVYRIAILYSGQVMTECVTMFLCIASVCVFLALIEHPSVFRAILTGVFLGLAVYFRINVALMGACFGFYAFAEHKPVAAGHLGRFLARAKYPVIIAFTSLVLIAPWSVRNGLILGEPVLFSASNAERFLSGANPVTRGEFTPVSSFPASWRSRLDPLSSGIMIEARKRLDKEKELLASEFLWKTHTAFFFAGLIPLKVAGSLFNEIWMWTGQGRYAASALPFGTWLRFPLIESMPIAVLGLLGLFIRGRRHRGFCAVLWMSLILPVIIALPTDGRYRYISEMPLLLSGAGALAKMLFDKDFPRRFSVLLAALACAAIVWSGCAWALVGGVNLFANPRLLEENPALRKTVESESVFSSPAEGWKMPVSIDIGKAPVSPRLCSHLAVSVFVRTGKPENMKNEMYCAAWPQFRMSVFFLDESGTTVSTSGFPHAPFGGFQTRGGEQWIVLEVPGLARSISLSFSAEGKGVIGISRLAVRGPVWLRTAEDY